MRRELRVAAGKEVVRAIRDPGMVGRDVVWHVIEDQREVPFRKFLPRRRQPVRSAKALVDHVVAHAVRRAQHIVLLHIR